MVSWFWLLSCRWCFFVHTYLGKWSNFDSYFVQWVERWNQKTRKVAKIAKSFRVKDSLFKTVVIESKHHGGFGYTCYALFICLIFANNPGRHLQNLTQPKTICFGDYIFSRKTCTRLPAWFGFSRKIHQSSMDNLNHSKGSKLGSKIPMVSRRIHIPRYSLWHVPVCLWLIRVFNFFGWNSSGQSITGKLPPKTNCHLSWRILVYQDWFTGLKKILQWRYREWWRWDESWVSLQNVIVSGDSVLFVICIFSRENWAIGYVGMLYWMTREHKRVEHVLIGCCGQALDLEDSVLRQTKSALQPAFLQRSLFSQQKNMSQYVAC